MWRLAKICSVLIAIFCVGEIAALAMLRPAYRDPFAPFERMLAGQSVSAADPACDLHPVKNNPPYAPDTRLSYCVLYPNQGAIASASAYVHGDRFVQTWLKSLARRRGDDLYIGDVVLRWGRPDLILNNEDSFFVRWTDQRLFGLIYPRGTTARFDYRLPIASLMIGLLGNSAAFP